MKINVKFQESEEIQSNFVSDDKIYHPYFGEFAGGGIGTTDYLQLDNKPQINSITLEGNLTAEELGLGKVYYDTKENWDAQTHLITERAAIYVYTNYEIIYDAVGNPIEIAGLKIGDGTSYLIDMPFVSDKITAMLLSHIGDNTIHITAAERDFWNNAAQSAIEAAAASAEAAAQSEQNAADYATDSESAAGRAEQANAKAEAAAVTANQAASDASAFAGTASTKATEAASSASAADQAKVTAIQKATDASASATAAAGSATNAGSAASAAAASATAAGNAQTAAETAQGKAEDAQEAVEAVLESIPEDYTELTEDVADLKRAINDPETGINTVEITSDWAKGQLKSDGTSGSSSVRIVTRSFSEALSAGAIVKCNNPDCIFAVAEYSTPSLSDFIAPLSDFGNQYTLLHDAYIKIMIQYADARTIQDSDLTVLPSALTIYPSGNLAYQVRSLENSAQSLEGYQDAAKDGYTFALKYITLVHRQIATDGSIGTVVRNYLASTPDFFSLPYNTVLIFDSPYAGQAYKFDENGNKIYASSQGLNRIFLEANKKYRFQIGYGSISGVLNFDDLRKHAYIYTESRMKTPVSYDFDKLFPGVISANHRGYNRVAPENTLPAYRLSKSKGFACGETDIQWTLDNVPVLLHDATINNVARMPDGSVIPQEIAIKDITYAQALEYDFGIKMGSEYAGTKIATLDEYLTLCRNLDYYTILQIGSSDPTIATQERCVALLEKAKHYGMQKSVLWLCANFEQAQWLIEADPCACVGLYGYSITESGIDSLASCLTGYNRLWFGFAYGKGEGTLNWNSDTAHNLCISRNIMIDVYDANLDASILALKPAVKIITSDYAVPSLVLYDNNIGDPNTGVLD